jgi:excisionase family DNA binding protein
MSVGAMTELASRRSAREPPRQSHQVMDSPRLVPASRWKDPGRATDRLTVAVAELVAALRAEIATESRPREREPDRLLSVDQAAQALGVGRTALYSEIRARRIRSVKVGRRRLIPSSAITDFASRQA